MHLDSNQGSDLMTKTIIDVIVEQLKQTKTERYPQHDKNLRQGIFCERCGLIMYADRYHADPIMRQGCLDCGGDLIWIRPDQQPEGDGF